MIDNQTASGLLNHKTESVNVKSGVSLDPRSLMGPNQKKRYANVDENGIVQNGGYSIQYLGKKDGEINC